MKKVILFSLLLVPTFAHADRLGALKSSSNVILTTQAVSASSQAASNVVNQLQYLQKSSASVSYLGISSAAVPCGTTGDVQINFNGTCAGVGGGTTGSLSGGIGALGTNNGVVTSFTGDNNSVIYGSMSVSYVGISSLTASNGVVTISSQAASNVVNQGQYLFASSAAVSYLGISSIPTTVSLANSIGSISLSTQTRGQLPLNLLQATGTWAVNGGTIAYTSSFASGTITDRSTITLQGTVYNGIATHNSTDTFTGQQLFAPGTVSLPGISFGVQSNTGFYRPSASTVRLSINGALNASWSASDYYIAGSLTVDPTNRIYLDGGSDTYIIEGAANNANIVSGGVVTSSFTSAGVAIRGTNTNNSPATGYVGEYISLAAGVTGNLTSGQWLDVSTITLTAGDWIVSGLVSVAPQTVNPVFTRVQIGISATAGNNATGLVDGDNMCDGYLPTSASNRGAASIPQYRVSLTGSTAYYLKVNAVWVTDTVKALGRISATRVR